MRMHLYSVALAGVLLLASSGAHAKEKTYSLPHQAPKGTQVDILHHFKTGDRFPQEFPENLYGPEDSVEIEVLSKGTVSASIKVLKSKAPPYARKQKFLGVSISKDY